MWQLWVMTLWLTQPLMASAENICELFALQPKWQDYAEAAEQKWQVPVALQMAILYQESAFNREAKPPRQSWLGVSWGKRLSTAKGLAQALDGTWNDYQKTAGWWLSNRASMAQSTDFLGWYLQGARSQLGFSPSDAYTSYLVYHEGVKGYKKQSHVSKPDLLRSAKRVAKRSRQYQEQLPACTADSFVGWLKTLWRTQGAT